MDFSFNCRTAKSNNNLTSSSINNVDHKCSSRTSPRPPTSKWTKPPQRPSCASPTRTACGAPCVNCLAIIMARSLAVHHIDCQLFQVECRLFSNFRTRLGRRAAILSLRASSSADYYVQDREIILQNLSERRTGIIIRTRWRLFGRLSPSMS